VKVLLRILLLKIQGENYSHQLLKVAQFYWIKSFESHFR